MRTIKTANLAPNLKIIRSSTDISVKFNSFSYKYFYDKFDG